MAALIKDWIEDIKIKAFYGWFAGAIKSHSITIVAIDDNKYKSVVII